MLLQRNWVELFIELGEHLEESGMGGQEKACREAAGLHQVPLTRDKDIRARREDDVQRDREQGGL